MSAQDIIVLAETQEGVLADMTAELLAGARQLASATGGQVICVLLSEDGAPYVDSLSAADRIVLINDPQLASFAPASFVKVLENVVATEQPRAVLVGSTSVGLDVGPALASKLDLPILIGCQKITAEGEALKVTSSIYGGKIMGDVEVTTAPAVLMLLPGSYRPATEAGQAQVETKPSPVPLSTEAITFEKMIVPDGGDVDITEEDILIAVGRGIQEEDDMEVAEELAESLNGQLCASRPVIDQGWLPATRQVGKSGMTVKPKCFIALGISGASEHVEGMKDSDLIIAVNSDADAPIFNTAHFGVVGDLLDIAPALTEAIKERSS
jgi:electron transfer flavoprotein alpha subunit